MAQKQHLYLLVHRSHQRFKVGLAVSPLLRWSQIQPHDQTDFAESLVFDIEPGVSASWAEKTLHRVLAKARVEMPTDVDGRTEWFDYAALETARAYARDHRHFLGVSEGYTISIPPRATRAPAQQPRGRGGALLSGFFPDDPTPHNAVVVAFVEERVNRWIASGSLLGSAESDHGHNLYFGHELISFEEASFHPYDSMSSALDLPSGTRMRRVTKISTGAIANATHVRLSIAHPFCAKEPLDVLTDPSCAKAGRAESWVHTTPGVEQLRTALRRLIDSAPVIDPEIIDMELEHARQQLWADLLGTP